MLYILYSLYSCSIHFYSIYYIIFFYIPYLIFFVFYIVSRIVDDFWNYFHLKKLFWLFSFQPSVSNLFLNLFLIQIKFENLIHFNLYIYIYEF